nr:DUF742 domain-containing protein [Micromonospora sp. DSM 115978]
MTPPPADAGRDPEPVIRIRPYLQAPPPRTESEPEIDAGGPEAEPDGPPQGLRPFVLTSGRVDSIDPAISLETQVTARQESTSWIGTPLSRLAPELREIVALCAEPMSVAEISARLRLHLGVTKILVGDLRATGHLDVHICDVEDAHDPDIILRVIDGLRAIS